MSGIAVAVAVLAAAAGAGVAAAKGKAAPAALPEDAGPPLELGDAKGKLMVLTDGKQHYVAVIPFGDIFGDLYYGDGKVFWSQRVGGGGANGTESFNKIFWEPRVDSPGKASFDFKDGKYVVRCDERRTELVPLPDADRDAMLASAQFFAPRWKHQAYSLSRDNNGKYYYVDKVRVPEQSKSFRLWAGQKGSMKQQKMINVVSDSEGDIFATKSGSLRLVLSKHESTWIAGKKKTSLIPLPIEDNHILVYTDLGAYTGERLGTPCDDL